METRGLGPLLQDGGHSFNTRPRSCALHKLGMAIGVGIITKGTRGRIVNGV